MTGQLPPDKLEYLRHLVRSGYMATVEGNAKGLCAPFWWYGASGEFKGGSICFVHTGERLLGVTAEHVHRECVEFLRRESDGACQIGGHSFEPERHLLDSDRDLDLAVYTLSEIQVNAARANIHYAPEWPPVVDESDVHLIGGWPWVLSRLGENSAKQYFLNFASRLSGSSDRQIGIATLASSSIPWGSRGLVPGTNLGGMSGGPLYRLRERGVAIMTLVGITYEYQPTFELALVRPLSLLNADGSIRRKY